MLSVDSAIVYAVLQHVLPSKSFNNKSFCFSYSHSSPENKPHHSTAVSTSHVKLESADRSVFLNSGNETFYAKDNYGLDFDFGIDDSTSLDRGSVSSTGTPILPDLSSASSFEDIPLDFSSDVSGLQARDSFMSKLSKGLLAFCNIF